MSLETLTIIVLALIAVWFVAAWLALRFVWADEPIETEDLDNVAIAGPVTWLIVLWLLIAHLAERGWHNLRSYWN